MSYSWNSDVNDLTKPDDPDDLEEMEECSDTIFDWEKLRNAAREVLPLLFFHSAVGHTCAPRDVGAVMRALGETEWFYGDIEQEDLTTLLFGLLAARAMCQMHLAALAAEVCVGHSLGQIDLAGVLACVRSGA